MKTIIITVLIGIALVFLASGCDNVTGVSEVQTDIQNRKGCIYARAVLLRGRDTVKCEWWFTYRMDDVYNRSLFNESGLMLSIPIDNILKWKEINYCK